MDQTFLYEVRPHKIITGIHGVAYIRSPRSVYLTKDEVLLCLQKGSVYRRFANLDKLERVTAYNLDRLHNEKFIPEDQWNGAPVVEEKKQEEVKPVEAPAPVVEEPVKEEVVEEAPVEEVAEAPAEEEKEEVVEEIDASEVVEEDPIDEEPAVEQKSQNNNFKHHGKKNRK